MFFYEYRDTLEIGELPADEKKLQEICRDATYKILEESQTQFLILYVKKIFGQYNFVIASKEKTDFATYLAKFFQLIKQENVDCELQETTFTQFATLVKRCAKETQPFIKEMLKKMELWEILRNTDQLPFVDDMLLNNNTSIQQRKKSATTELFSSSLVAEIQRIYATRNVPQQLDHPVHYLLKADDEKVRSKMLEILMNSLIEQQRVKTRRVTTFSVGKLVKEGGPGIELLEKIYEENSLGTVAIGIPRLQNFFDAPWFSEAVRIMTAYRHQVLTVLYTDEETLVDDVLMGRFKRLSFVSIYQDAIKKEEAASYFRYRTALEGFLFTDTALFLKLLGEQESYQATEIYQTYDEWRDEQELRANFPQYDELKTAADQLPVVQKKPIISSTSSAYEKLQKMIGLREVKKVIDSALAYHRMQQIMKERGISNHAATMHMVFSGNPGTAKTTVARLFGEIMKERGILEVGGFIEVGRGDLVAQYVGQTAPKVSALFKKAKGSVLFIDEAYALVDDNQRSFGDEAIDTIVAEMENHREDVVVIFAGYPEEMADFVERNPGLKSRLAYEVSFPNYSKEELFAIGKLEAEKRGLHFSEEVEAKFLSVIESLQKDDPKNFGNGRTVRNMIEHSMMSVAMRLAKSDFSEVSDEALTTLQVEDFNLQEILVKNPGEKQIGFR